MRNLAEQIYNLSNPEKPWAHLTTTEQDAYVQFSVEMEENIFSSIEAILYNWDGHSDTAVEVLEDIKDAMDRVRY